MIDRYILGFETGVRTIQEQYHGVVLRLPASCWGLVDAIRAHWNEQDRADMARWRKLDQIELDQDVYTMGRQSYMIGGGCPFRLTDPRYDEFNRGRRLQMLLDTGGF